MAYRVLPLYPSSPRVSLTLLFYFSSNIPCSFPSWIFKLALPFAWKAFALALHHYVVLSSQVISLENSNCPPLTLYPIAFSVTLTFICLKYLFELFNFFHRLLSFRKAGAWSYLPLVYSSHSVNIHWVKKWFCVLLSISIVNHICYRIIIT